MLLDDVASLSKIQIYHKIFTIIHIQLDKDYHPDKKVYGELLAKSLRFKQYTDPFLFRACLDQLEDAQFAINSFWNYGLQTDSEDFGEMYLRIYGLLNAAYLQAGVVIDLMKLFEYNKQAASKRNLKTSQLMQLRNKIASHSTSYQNPSDPTKFEFFRLAQSTIDKWGSRILIVSFDEQQYFDLRVVLNEFTLIEETILEDVLRLAIQRRQFKKEAMEDLVTLFNHVSSRPL